MVVIVVRLRKAPPFASVGYLAVVAFAGLAAAVTLKEVYVLANHWAAVL